MLEKQTLLFWPQFEEVEKLEVSADTFLFAVAFGHSVAFFTIDLVYHCQMLAIYRTSKSTPLGKQ